MFKQTNEQTEKKKLLLWLIYQTRVKTMLYTYGILRVYYVFRYVEEGKRKQKNKISVGTSLLSL